MTDIVLTPKADIFNLNGTYRYDTWYGRGGNDDMSLSWGNDVAYGQAGNDNIYGDNGSDIIFGGAGDDRLNGGYGQDYIYGQRGNDALYDFYDDGSYNYLIGGVGNDNITMFSGYVQAGPGNDIIYLDPSNYGSNDVWMGRGQDYLSVWLDEPYAQGDITILDFKAEDRIHLEAFLPGTTYSHKTIVDILDDDANGYFNVADGMFYDAASDTSSGVTLDADGDLCLVWQNQNIIFDQLFNLKVDTLL